MHIFKRSLPLHYWLYLSYVSLKKTDNLSCPIIVHPAVTRFQTSKGNHRWRQRSRPLHAWKRVSPCKREQHPDMCLLAHMREMRRCITCARFAPAWQLKTNHSLNRRGCSHPLQSHLICIWRSAPGAVGERGEEEGHFSMWHFNGVPNLIKHAATRACKYYALIHGICW